MRGGGFREMYAESVTTSQVDAPRATVAFSQKAVRVERIAGSDEAGVAEFSIIVAGRDAQRRAAITAQLRERFKNCRYEILYVNDPPSLAAAYNTAIAQAASEQIILMHDDAEILNADALERIHGPIFKITISSASPARPAW